MRSVPCFDTLDAFACSLSAVAIATSLTKGASHLVGSLGGSFRFCFFSGLLGFTLGFSFGFEPFSLCFFLGFSLCLFFRFGLSFCLLLGLCFCFLLGFLLLLGLVGMKGSLVVGDLVS